MEGVVYAEYVQISQSEQRINQNDIKLLSFGIELSGSAKIGQKSAYFFFFLHLNIQYIEFWKLVKQIHFSIES